MATEITESYSPIRALLFPKTFILSVDSSYSQAIKEDDDFKPTRIQVSFDDVHKSSRFIFMLRHSTNRKKL